MAGIKIDFNYGYGTYFNNGYGKYFYEENGSFKSKAVRGFLVTKQTTTITNAYLVKGLCMY